MTALVAAPSVSGAAPARVKQFVASITGGTGNSLTMTVTNCGGPSPLPDDCTAASTIGLGAVQIAVPTGFQPASNVHASSGATTWTNAGYNQATKSVEVISPGGSNKLNPGQSLVMTFNVPTTATCLGGNEFTTKAWGANAIAGSDPFAIQGPQPTLGCVTSPGGTVIGPDGQTETITGNFAGTLFVTFGGDLSCSFDPDFGAQWSQFHLPTQVNILPGPDFVGNGPKIATSRFPTQGNDSSSYLTCWAVPDTGQDPFRTRSGEDATVVTIGGTDFFVGILPNCYDPTTEPPSINPEPCVSEQFLDLTTDEIVISVRMPEGDPARH